MTREDELDVEQVQDQSLPDTESGSEAEPQEEVVEAAEPGQDEVEGSKSKSSAWSEAVFQLPTLRSTSSGPYVKLLQAALNAFGGGNIKIDGKMNPSTKGALKRNLDEGGFDSSNLLCTPEVWRYLLGGNPPQYATDPSSEDKSLYFLQALLSIHGYPVGPSGYWNDQTERFIKELGRDHGVKSAEKSAKLTVNLWVRLLSL